MRSAADLLFEGIGRGISAVAAAADPDLPELLRESEGRRLAIVVRGTDRVLEVDVRDGKLRVLPPRRLAGAGSPAAASGEGRSADPSSGSAEGRGTEADADAPSAAASGAAGPTDPAAGGGHAAAPALLRGEGGDLPGGSDLALVGNVPDFVRFLLAIRSEPPPEDPFGSLEVHGDPTARDGFVDLLRRIEPDYESLVARAAGGVVAHAMARTTVGRLFHARRSAERLVDDLTEFLEEETRLVPEPAARARFAGGVEALLDRVAELEGRLDRVRRRD